MSEGTLRTPACHRRQAKRGEGGAAGEKEAKLIEARPGREGVTVHCVCPAALAPADRPQESGSP